VASSVRLLLVWDRDADAELVLAALRQGGFAPEASRVETREEFDRHLDPPPDAVISAFRLARFDAMAALLTIKERGLDIPVIVVSGTAGEDMAVSAMKAGITDYLLEDRLGRLGEALSEALESKKLRDEAVAAEAVLYDVEAPYRTLVEQIPGITYVSERGMDGPFRFVSPRLTQILGFTPEEWMADPAGGRTGSIPTTSNESRPKRTAFAPRAVRSSRSIGSSPRTIASSGSGMNSSSWRTTRATPC
jgi:DNA-binding NarL/FixJ family response regulator